jgi:hypothetical protein
MKRLAYADLALGLMGFVFGSAGFAYMASRPSIPQTVDLLGRAGFTCVLVACIWTATVGYAVCVAFMAKTRKWSPQTCGRVGLPFNLAGVVIGFAYVGQPASRTGLFIITGAIALPHLVRKFAFPDLPPKQLSEQSPTVNLLSK